MPPEKLRFHWHSTPPVGRAPETRCVCFELECPMRSNFQWPLTEGMWAISHSDTHPLGVSQNGGPFWMALTDRYTLGATDGYRISFLQEDVWLVTPTPGSKSPIIKGSHVLWFYREANKENHPFWGLLTKQTSHISFGCELWSCC